MKKHFLLGVLLWLLCVSWLTYADDQNIWNITVRFCSGDEHLQSLNLVADNGIDYEICMNFINSMDSEVKLKYSFVDGTITNDEFANKACTIDEVTNFWQFVTQTEHEIVIPARDIVHQTASVKFPIGMSGVVNGCLVYSIVKNEPDTNTENSMFNVEVRKASFITALVWWDVYRTIEQNNKISRKFSRKDKMLNIMVPISNKGNIDEQTSFSWSIKNILNYNHDFNVSRKILANTDHILLIEIDDIPRYRMFYKLNWTISSEWAIDFDPSLLGDTSGAPIIIPADLCIFIFPRSIVFILIGCTLLWFIIRYLSKHLRFEK